MFISVFLLSLLLSAVIYRFVQKVRTRNRLPVIRTKLPFDV